MILVSLEEKNRLIGHLQAGVSQKQVSQIFNVSNQTVSNLRRKFDETDSMQVAARSGMPKKTTNETDLQILLNHTADPVLPAQLQSLHLEQNYLNKV